MNNEMRTHFIALLSAMGTELNDKHFVCCRLKEENANLALSVKKLTEENERLKKLISQAVGAEGEKYD